MADPKASRPHMPGYGLLGASEGSGLLPWSWAERQLAASRNYWVVTLWPDGRPHAMPVWAVWDADDRSLWFASSLRSRKARNVAGDPRCVITTDNADDPVVVEGTAEIVTDGVCIARVIELINEKYSTEYAVDFLDPTTQATVRIRPRWAFGLLQADFEGSPTRWEFDVPPASG
jgi:PPOX class probable F420-dependent enzyme